MADVGLKTPVSCLQEYLVARKMVPHYELTHCRTGTHNPEFTFRVQVGDISEEGTGRSKQEAKHRAAEKMLKSLNVIDKEVVSEDTSESIIEPTQNYVGQLKELCVFQHYPEPNYYLEEAAGPDHSKVFKMVCCVSQLQDFGVSRTKKQAKQEAAFKMLERLKEVKSDDDVKKEVTLNVTPEIKTETLSVAVTDEDESPPKPQSSTPMHKDPTVLYKDQHKAYRHLHESSPTLASIFNETCPVTVENALSLVEKIAQELEMKVTITKVPTKKPNVYYTVVSICAFPPMAAVGFDENLAAFNLIDTLTVLGKD